MALAANTLLAASRFRALAKRHGTPIGLAVALQANAVAALGSLFVFSFMGQAVARATILRRSGMPASTTITLTLFERAVAALVLGIAAVFSAFYLFDQLTLREEVRSGYLLRVLACFLFAAGLVLATIYRRFLARAAKSIFSRHVGTDLLVVGAFSFFIHFAMLVAYAALAIGFGAAPTASLIAACLVVMFAASLPISFGGWGIREMSAGVALSLVGLSAIEGITIGAAIGIGALAAQLLVGFLATTRGSAEVSAEAVTTGAHRPRPDYTFWLGVLTPVLTSVAVIFSLHLTLATSKINLNLADPLAIIGGMLFIAHMLEQRRLPVWQVSHFNLIFGLLTCVIALSALHGYLSFGYSDWGLRNRFIGWFVLLAYMATGALLVARLGAFGREILLKGFVVALCTVACFDVVAKLLAQVQFGFADWGESYRLEGFSQNPNAYAFLLLAGLAIVIALLRKGAPPIWILCGGVLAAAIFLASSRAGWGAGVFMLLAALVLDRRMGRRLIDVVLAGATILALFFGLIELSEIISRLGISFGGGPIDNELLRDFLRPPGTNAYSDSERWISILGGWSLWSSNPVFGAGLGAYYEQTRHEGAALTIHNSFLWLAAEMGVVGLAVFAAGGLHVFVATWRRLRDPADEAATVLVLLSICFVTMAMVHDLMYQRILWFLAGACLALPPALPRSADSSLS